MSGKSNKKKKDYIKSALAKLAIVSDKDNKIKKNQTKSGLAKITIMGDKDNKKKKNHTKSGLAKIASAAVAVAGIVITIMKDNKKN